MGIRNGKPILLAEHLEFLMKTSGLTEEQVRTKYEHFLRAHPDNKINRNVFQEMIEQVRTEVQPLTSEDTDCDPAGHPWKD